MSDLLLWTLLQIALWVLTLFCHVSFGYWLVQKIGTVVQRLRNARGRKPIHFDGIYEASFFFGLLTHLFLITLCGMLFFRYQTLQIVNAAWPKFFWATATAVFVLPWGWYGRRFVFQSKALISTIRLPFCLWFTVIFALGLSLFDAVDGIRTPWVNNYGDLPIHLGLISSFTFGENFPPQYQIFSGEPLSYPFFMDLWSALLWWPFPSWVSLDLIFTLQWTLLWCLIYRLLNGSRFVFLPWALLLGGGSYYFVFKYFTAANFALEIPYAHTLLNKGYPWAPFLTTIWVTQRPMLLGLGCLLSSLRLFHDHSRHAETHRNLVQGNGRLASQVALVTSCVILALSPLAHVHCAIVGLSYVYGVLLVRILFNLWKRNRNQSAGQIKTNIAELIVLSVFISLPLLLSFSFLHRKWEVIKFKSGWMPWRELPQWYGVLGDGMKKTVLESALMWLANAPFLLIIFALSWMLIRRHQNFLVIAVLFFLGNVICLAIWDWDQIKFFVALYAVFLSLLSSVQCRWWVQLSVLLLIIPATFEGGRTLKREERHLVFDEKDIALAKKLRENTPACAVFLAKPDHNSPVMLSGRKMFLGYNGWLASHGLNYLPREQFLYQHFAQASSDISQVLPLFDEASQRCGHYVIWSDREKSLWNLTEALSHGFLEGTEVEGLYRVVERFKKGKIVYSINPGKILLSPAGFKTLAFRRRLQQVVSKRTIPRLKTAVLAFCPSSTSD